LGERNRVLVEGTYAVPIYDWELPLNGTKSVRSFHQFTERHATTTSRESIRKQSNVKGQMHMRQLKCIAARSQNNIGLLCCWNFSCKVLL